MLTKSQELLFKVNATNNRANTDKCPEVLDIIAQEMEEIQELVIELLFKDEEWKIN